MTVVTESVSQAFTSVFDFNVFTEILGCRCFTLFTIALCLELECCFGPLAINVIALLATCVLGLLALNCCNVRILALLVTNTRRSNGRHDSFFFSRSWFVCTQFCSFTRLGVCPIASRGILHAVASPFTRSLSPIASLPACSPSSHYFDCLALLMNVRSSG